MDLESLIQRATSGRTVNRDRMFKPSLTYAVMNDPYTVWCDYHAPREEAVDETTTYDELRMKWGLEYEARWVREHHPYAVEIHPRWGVEALKATLKAMLDGASAIYQPQLWDLQRDMYGLGDVLVRDDSAPSDLGSYHYRVEEIKRSKSLQDYHGIQAAFYTMMVGRTQGREPSRLDVVLRTETVSQPPSTYGKGCEDVLETWRKIRDGALTPTRPGCDEASSPWRVWTNKMLDLEQDLSLNPAIPASCRDKLRKALGATKVADLRRLTIADLRNALGPVVGTHCHHRIEAARSGKPVLAPGAIIAIPRRKRSIYFDFETCDANHPRIGPHVYMIGAYDLEAKTYRVFVSRGAAEEARIFEEFLDWIGDLPSTCLYHWTPYEIGQIGQVRERHPQLAARLAALIESCVDLKACIAKKMFFGTRSYSIKEAAPFLGFHWRQADVGAFESMVLYWEWVEDGDQKKIDKVIRYNEDDCLAMVHVDQAIQSILKDAR